MESDSDVPTFLSTALVGLDFGQNSQGPSHLTQHDSSAKEFAKDGSVDAY